MMGPSSVDDILRATRYLRSGEYSDFTIKCGEKTFNVHRAVLGASSEFFAKAFKTRFGKGDHPSINLAEDDLEVVARMIVFSYAGDYPCLENGLTVSRVFDRMHSTPERCKYDPGWWRPISKDREGRAGWEPEAQGLPVTEDDSDHDEATKADLLSLHASVYGIAEKYDLDALKELSRRRYLASLAIRIEPQDFINSVAIIYSTTLKTDDLRKHAAWTAQKYRRGLRDIPEFKELWHGEPDFACDFLANYRAVDGVWRNCCSKYYSRDEDWCLCDLYE
jgi:hypothetical protein